MGTAKRRPVGRRLPCCLSRARRRPHPAEPAAVKPRRCRACQGSAVRRARSAPLRVRVRRGRLKQVRAGVGIAAGDGQRARRHATGRWCHTRCPDGISSARSGSFRRSWAIRLRCASVRSRMDAAAIGDTHRCTAADRSSRSTNATATRGFRCAIGDVRTIVLVWSCHAPVRRCQQPTHAAACGARCSARRSLASSAAPRTLVELRYHRPAPAACASEEVLLPRHAHRRRPRPNVQLGVDAAQVRRDRAWPQPEPRRHLLIRRALRHHLSTSTSRAVSRVAGRARGDPSACPAAPARRPPLRCPRRSPAPRRPPVPASSRALPPTPPSSRAR